MGDPLGESEGMVFLTVGAVLEEGAVCVCVCVEVAVGILS